MYNSTDRVVRFDGCSALCSCSLMIQPFSLNLCKSSVAGLNMYRAGLRSAHDLRLWFFVQPRLTRSYHRP